MKSAYVIAAWGGPRRVEDPLYERDRTIYIRHHLEQLDKLRHNLDLVIVAVPESPDHKGFAEKLYHETPYMVRGTRVETFYRENNIGLAFGSFEDVFVAYRDQGFDSWFWFEDDYVPLRDNFDKTMESAFADGRHQKEASFVAARVNRHDSEGMPHAIISIGMTTTTKIDEVRAKYGGFVYLKKDTGSDYRAHEVFMSQRKFTNTFQDFGELVSLGDSWCVGLRSKRGAITWYNRSKPRLIGPIQILRPWFGGTFKTAGEYA